MLEWIVLKPRGPESGCSSQIVVERQGRDKQVVEKVRLSWALNQLMSEILVYFV